MAEVTQDRSLDSSQPSDAAETAQMPQTQRRSRPYAMLIVVGLALLLVFLFGMKLLKDGLTQLETGPAPTFTIKTYDDPKNVFNLIDHRGKVVVINFWASWCGPCRSEAPDLNAVWSEFKDRGVVFIGVGYLDNDADARAFLREFGIQYITGPDNGTDVSKAYRVKGVPETYIVDKMGNLAVTIPGPTTAKDLREILNRLLTS